jgi:hypothetical protein
MEFVVLSNEMCDVSARKERINAEVAEHSEGMEKKHRRI